MKYSNETNDFIKQIKKNNFNIQDTLLRDTSFENGNDLTCLSILNPLTGNYESLNSSTLIKKQNPQKGEFGYIPLCQKCWKTEPLNLCAWCKFFSHLCSDRSRKAHFKLNFDIIPEGHFEDDEDSLHEKRQKSRIFSARNVFLLALTIGCFTVGAYKITKKKHNAPPANN